jgi:hypothetical protein
MATFSYAHVIITWDSKRETWIATLDGRETTGMQNILNVIGSKGWELVNVIGFSGSFQNLINADQPWDTNSVQAYFKKRNE